jgi:hypothetical protein
MAAKRLWIRSSTVALRSDGRSNHILALVSYRNYFPKVNPAKPIAVIEMSFTAVHVSQLAHRVISPRCGIWSLWGIAGIN